jgi:hypothetical protein
MVAKIKQSLAGVIRERLDDIERQMEIGIRQESIVAELAKDGHVTTLTNFRIELCRARKRRKSKTETQANKVPEKKIDSVAESVKKVVENPLVKSVGYDHSKFKNLSDSDLI